MKANKEQQINLAEESLLHVYNRYSLVLDHGDGMYLYDTDGKKYLDLRPVSQSWHSVITIRSTMMR